MNILSRYGIQYGEFQTLLKNKESVKVFYLQFAKTGELFPNKTNGFGENMKIDIQKMSVQKSKNVFQTDFMSGLVFNIFR